MIIIDIMMAISNWLWGWPLLILTSAVAVYLFPVQIFPVH